MVKFFTLMVAVFLAFALIACTGEKVEQAKTEEQTTTEAAGVTAEMVKCPGCDMEMDKTKMVAHESEGETTYFCSEECKTNYLAKLEAGAEKKKDETPPPPPNE